MQVAAVPADTFPHLQATVDTLVRGVTASLPGGPRVSAILVIALIVGVNVVLVLAMLKGFKAVGGIKTYLSDFPSHNASTGLSLILIFETGLVVLIRLALGLIFPDGYETWIYALVGLAGVNVAGLIGKRATDDKYVQAKAMGKASAGPSVNVEGDATVTATATGEHSAIPQAGTRPTNPAVVAGVEAIAKTQRVTFGGSSQ